MSDDEYDELPPDATIYAPAAIERINDFFADERDDLETLDLQSTIAPSTIYHGKTFGDGRGGRFRGNQIGNAHANRGNFNRRNDRNSNGIPIFNMKF